MDQAHRLGLGRRQRLTGGHHLQRVLGIGQARNPLGAAGAREDAHLDFGQRHLAVVAVARVGESDDPDRASRLRGSRVTGSSNRAHTLVVGVVVG